MEQLPENDEMHSQFSISSIIITYNRPDYAVIAFDSIKNQKRPPEEIIIIDGSAESFFSLQYFQERAPQYSGKIQYHRITNKGPGNARNVGAELANSQWLAFLDDDDAWLPDFLLIAAEHLETGGYDAFVAPRLNRSSSEEWMEPIPWLPRTDFEIYGRNHGVSGSNMVIWKETFNALQGFDTKLRAMQDVDLFVRFLKNGKKVYIHNKALVVRGVGAAEHLSGIAGRPNPWRVRGLRRFIVKHRREMPRRAYQARLFDLALSANRLNGRPTLGVFAMFFLCRPRAFFYRLANKFAILRARQTTRRRTACTEILPE